MTRRVRPDDPVARILVVCTGNICRSPLAAALLARHATRVDAAVEVTSAGVHGLTGEPATVDMCAEATSRGLDLSPHRAAVAEREIVADADLVIAMTTRQRTQLARIAPRAKERVFTLKELARLSASVAPPEDGTPLRERLDQLVRAAHHARALTVAPRDSEDVADPYGGSREGYRRCADEIEQLVDRLAPWLFGSADGVDRGSARAAQPGSAGAQG
ncbi:MAG TPA: hypothetical protein VGV67_02820 [Solirubrobacteraceae bacterium]|nr:hypothetical protein [Solirubrobacteraceae bacterium]